MLLSVDRQVENHGLSVPAIIATPDFHLYLPVIISSPLSILTCYLLYVFILSTAQADKTCATLLAYIERLNVFEQWIEKISSCLTALLKDIHAVELAVQQEELQVILQAILQVMISSTM